MAKNGIELIAEERARQITREGWTPEHDTEHDGSELAWAAVCYAAPAPIRARVLRYKPCSCREACCQHLGGTIAMMKLQDPWPWDAKWDKRKKHDRLRQLTIAGALIAAEIDRLQREAKSSVNVTIKEKRNGRESMVD